MNGQGELASCVGGSNSMVLLEYLRVFIGQLRKKFEPEA
jgi:hypothetical protein